jgi:hypothetical protein
MAANPQPLVVDWVALLDEVRRYGVRTSGVAEITRIPRQTIDAYRNGTSSPSHANGETLIKLWTGLTNKPRAVLPMTQQFASAATFHD